MLVLYLGGELDTGFVLSIFPYDNPPSTTSADALHSLSPDGEVMEHEAATDALMVLLSSTLIECTQLLKTIQLEMSHVLRHSFVCRIMMAGGNIVVLRCILGHSDMSVTMRYAHFSPGHLKDSIHCNPLPTTDAKNGDKVAAEMTPR
ncbi:tyrosine-type recombinase/integrase [Pantoea sp. A4]|uniref:tyrosine-type recombinase/integrase n=1 Tax=Pantoea sp. A4 TaxID=1225184 RepID=UPI00178CF33C